MYYIFIKFGCLEEHKEGNKMLELVYLKTKTKLPALGIST
jgi:hypothetical protein